MIEFDFEFGKREEFDEKKEFVKKKFSDSQVKCNVCEKIFQNKLQLRKHRRIHRGKQTCTNCGKVIAGSTDMSNHIRSCQKIQNFKCTICNFKTGRNYQLQDHLRKMHTVTPTMGYSCTLCDFISATKAPLKAHISKDHPKFPCIICGKRLLKAVTLERHIMLSHDKQFPCLTCGKTFPKADTLETHIILSHDKDEIVRRKEGKKKTYPCSNCDYVADRKESLKGHQWNIHVREKVVKPKIIRQCKKGCGFTTKWGNRNRQRHEELCQFGGVFVLI